MGRLPAPGIDFPAVSSQNNTTGYLEDDLQRIGNLNGFSVAKTTATLAKYVQHNIFGTAKLQQSR